MGKINIAEIFSGLHKKIKGVNEREVVIANTNYDI